MHRTRHRRIAIRKPSPKTRTGNLATNRRGVGSEARRDAGSAHLLEFVRPRNLCFCGGKALSSTFLASLLRAIPLVEHFIDHVVALWELKTHGDARQPSHRRSTQPVASSVFNEAALLDFFRSRVHFRRFVGRAVVRGSILGTRSAFRRTGFQGRMTCW